MAEFGFPPLAPAHQKRQARPALALMRQGSVLWGPIGPAIPRRRFDRNWSRQRRAGDNAGRRRARGRLMVCRGGESHFIPPHVSSHMFIERGYLSVAPVFVEDV